MTSDRAGRAAPGVRHWFSSAVSVTADGRTAGAKSVLGVTGLGATSGQHVTVYAAGPDAREAVAALITILSEVTKVGG